MKKRVTKVQAREKTRKGSAKRRVAVALKKFLHQANPAGKYAGASIQRLKGGVLKITPIKANAAQPYEMIRAQGRQGNYRWTVLGYRYEGKTRYTPQVEGRPVTSRSFISLSAAKKAAVAAAKRGGR